MTITTMASSSSNNNNSSSSNWVFSSSSSSSSRSPPSSTTSTLLLHTPKRRTMEEVWKDIGLCSLHHRRDTPIAPPPNHHHHHHSHSAAASPSLRAIILQDFLAGPLNRSHADHPLPAAEDMPLPQPSATPPTALSLSPSLDIQFLGAVDARATSNSRSSSNAASYHLAPFISPAFSDNVVAPPSPIGLFSFCSKKVMSESLDACGDRRHKRMIKNRESAARSRARKQAYINELELEVAQLLEENSKLKTELEELRSAMATKQVKRSTLHRSSTAPF